MRLIIIVLTLLTFSSAFTQKACPIYGDKNVKKYRILDSLKNRNEIGMIDSSVTLEKILTRIGNDTSDYNSSQYVSITGYVILVKYGGKETANCHSLNSSDWDIHIELALHPTDKAKQSMVLEINRYTRKDSLDYTLKNLRKLIGKKVVAEGFMLLDAEHLHNAVTTNPKGTNLWRYTAHEIHPLMSIKEAN